MLLPVLYVYLIWASHSWNKHVVVKNGVLFALNHETVAEGR